MYIICSFHSFGMGKNNLVFITKKKKIYFLYFSISKPYCKHYKDELIMQTQNVLKMCEDYKDVNKM